MWPSLWHMCDLISASCQSIFGNQNSPPDGLKLHLLFPVLARVEIEYFQDYFQHSGVGSILSRNLDRVQCCLDGSPGLRRCHSRQDTVHTSLFDSCTAHVELWQALGRIGPGLFCAKVSNSHMFFATTDGASATFMLLLCNCSS